MPDQCPFAKEFNVLIEYFFEKNIMTKQSTEDIVWRNRGQPAAIDFEAFYKIQKQNSLLLMEFWEKLLGKWMVPKIDIFDDPTIKEGDTKQKEKKKKGRKPYMPIKPGSWGSFSSILRRGVTRDTMNTDNSFTTPHDTSNWLKDREKSNDLGL